MKKNIRCFICLLIGSVFSASAQTVLLSENFEGWTTGTYGAQAAGWVSIKVPTSGTQWGTTTLSIAHSGTKSIYAPLSVSDYMITSGQNLTAGVTYTFSFWYRTYTAGNGFTVNVYVGTGQSVVDMTGGTLLGTFNPNSTTFLQATYSFTPSSSGTYYFCVNSSAGNSGPTYTYVDDWLITAPSTCTSNCVGWLNQNCTTCSAGCYLDGGTITPTVTLQTSSTAATTSNYGFVYWTFNASADSTYYFDLCSSTGTTGSSQLRLHKARITSPGNNYCMDVGSTPTLITQNKQNGCAGTGTGLSKLIWTCPVSGTYYLESTSGGVNYWGQSGNQTAVLSYRTLSSSAISSCADAFNDKGTDGDNGAVYNYNNNESWTFTIYPDDTMLNAVNIQFSSFSTAPGDILCVYDGSSINDPIIGCYSGPSITGSFQSIANNGSLTFQFTSDDSLISTGWQTNVSCLPRDIDVRNNYSSADKIRLYPNPVKDELQITGYEFGIGEIKIYNVVGEKIFEQLLTQNSKPGTLLNVSALTPGIYFLKAENESGIWNARFVKD